MLHNHVFIIFDKLIFGVFLLCQISPFPNFYNNKVVMLTPALAQVIETIGNTMQRH